MLYFGIDVLVLSIIGLVCVALCAVTMRILCVSQPEGTLAVVCTATCAGVMLLGYVVMAGVLDAMLGI